jgi:hypothetical protein
VAGSGQWFCDPCAEGGTPCRWSRRSVALRALKPSLRQLHQAALDLVRDIPREEVAATPRAFTQDGALTPTVLILGLLFMAADAGRRGYSQVLEELWREARTFKLRLQSAVAVTAEAFCNARKKLAEPLMSRLVQQVATQTSSAAGKSGKWKGRRLYAIDGSKISLPRSPALFETYGGPTGAHHPQMLAMVLMDVVLKQAIDFVTARYRTSERTAFVPLLRHIAPGAVLLLDRGFEGFATFALLKERGIDFVIRCRTTKGFQAIERFARSPRKEAWLDLQPPSRSKRRQPLKLRVVRYSLPNGGVEILMTTLTKAIASAREIGELYWKRWHIEGYFREIKACWFSANQFHSTRVGGPEQEFGARVLFTAIRSAFLIAAAARHSVPFDDISRKAAFLRLVSSITRLVLLVDQAALRREFRQIFAAIARHRNKKRPGRSHPRRSFALLSKWGAEGRNGTHHNGKTR